MTRRFPLVLLSACVAAIACRESGRTPQRPEAIRVSAAVSLTESLTRAAEVWQEQTGRRVTPNFAASNVLARQIEEGAPVDVFLSADEMQMQALVARGLIDRTSVFPLLSNRLVIVTPGDRPLPVASPAGLADPRVHRVAIGDPAAVPAGVYAKQWLERIGLWPDVQRKIVPSASVRAALAAVEAGNADAGIVYRTDARGRRGVGVSYEVPREESPRIVYPVAVVKRTKDPNGAAEFVRWLRSAEAQAIFASFGFLPVQAGSDR